MIVEEKSEKTVESSAEPVHAEPGQTTSRAPTMPLRGLFIVVLLAALVGAYVIYTGLTSRSREFLSRACDTCKLGPYRRNDSSAGHWRRRRSSAPR